MKKLLYKILFGYIYLISLLPFWILHRISDFFYVLIYYVIGYRKKKVLENMRNCFPEKTEQEIRKIRKQFYQHFADLLVESLKSASITQKVFQQRYKVKNWDKFSKILSTGKSVIILSAHTGNWEWVFALVHQIPCTTYAVYQKLTNPYMDDYVKHTRQRYEAVMVSTKEAFGRILESVENKEQTVSWFAADQACRPEKATWMSFLNQDTTFHSGYESLAKQTGQAVYYLDIKKIKRSHYELDFIPISENPKEETDGIIVERFAQLTEKRIQANPTHWLWSHDRWKHKRQQN
jgi:KDO2-lipid IV(A) lauroyltransferase